MKHQTVVRASSRRTNRHHWSSNRSSSVSRGISVPSSQDGTTEFHVLVPSSAMHKPDETDILWLSSFYAAQPPVCEGDDLGTTYESVGSVLLAAALTSTRSACDLTVITSLPSISSGWSRRRWKHMICGSRKVSSTLSGLCASGGRTSRKSSRPSGAFWTSFGMPSGPGATDALTTLRERRLFGGMMQTWTDEDALLFFN